MAHHPQPPQPHPELIAADSILPTTRKHIERLRAARDEVVEGVSLEAATYENVVRPLANAQHAIEDSVGIIAMLRYAAPDEHTRKAAEQARDLWNEAFGEFNDRHDVYLLLQAVKDRSEPLDAESRKYLDELLADFVRCGHGRLKSEEIAQYVTTRTAIDKLRRKFTENIRNASGGMWFSEADLDGVKEQDLSRFRTAAKNQQTKTTIGDTDCFVTLSKHDVSAVLQYAKDPHVRERLYVANHSKLSENLPIFNKVVLLRDENARQLGYPSHAAFRLERRLAKTTGWVYDFMDKLEETLLPKGLKEREKLLSFRSAWTSQHEHKIDDTQSLLAWDYPYWKRLAREDTAINHDKIAEYFPIKAVVQRMLDLFSQCLQMRFDKAYSLPVWDPEVEAWEVWDNRPGKEQEFIGYLYMDLMFRLNKHRGCQNVNLRPSYIDSSGKRVYPATLLMCNFPPYTPLGSASCILLKHEQIVSLFHELGHGVHDLVSRTQYSRFHGWRSPPDYAEALAIMLENWCWDSKELKHLSCHYTALDPKLLQEWKTQHPGEEEPPITIPDVLLNPLSCNRNSFRALYLLDELVVARFDMAVHDLPAPEACEALNPTKLFADLEARLTLLSVPNPSDRGHPHVHFPHLLAGYDAGYYSYLSGQVFAAEMFAEFADDLRNRETWERLRSTVLERGASGDELQNLQDFLGRVPGAKALLPLQVDE
ncbi:zincin [Acrodontium crateriforme]|uniref:Zincin n=1 Tax=Acrodontium crateriforme TaxID=150365 RepID=A0AAQ3M1B0_9PEZI|nr:zincin [Acrodontium crateriforme]